jgi:hypothetical protein
MAIWDRHAPLGILIFKVLTARRLCKSFGVKGLTPALEWVVIIMQRPL